MVYCFLIKGELYMKHLLILLCVSTLASCGIKDVYLSSPSGTLGVPKQLPPPTKQTQVNTQLSEHNTNTQDSEKSNVVDAPISEKSEESTFKWYYAVPFMGLAFIAFLVYRLKQQNLKSL